jgi:hypothetical protein
MYTGTAVLYSTVYTKLSVTPDAGIVKSGSVYGNQVRSAFASKFHIPIHELIVKFTNFGLGKLWKNHRPWPAIARIQHRCHSQEDQQTQRNQLVTSMQILLSKIVGSVEDLIWLLRYFFKIVVWVRRFRHDRYRYRYQVQPLVRFL